MSDLVQRLRDSATQARALDRSALLNEAADEIERLRQHRCLWGNDPSGPYYSDEYLLSREQPPETK